MKQEDIRIRTVIISSNYCGSDIVMAMYPSLSLLAELRRYEGPPTGASYSYRKEKETHALIF